MPRKIVAGNWKMNGVSGLLTQVVKLKETHPNPGVDILLCPPATLLSRLGEVAHPTILTGGQDCHAKLNGAHTGDISAQMLQDAGASHVILGHSERRQDHGETNADICAKADAAFAAELTAIICIGESLAQRETGETLAVLETQLSGSVPDRIPHQALIIAYEPIWAIGTGKVPTIEQIKEVHDFIREYLINRFGETLAGATPLLYGGSVKPGNAAQIFAVENVDGALVGGASLLAADLSPIITALEHA